MLLENCVLESTIVSTNDTEPKRLRLIQVFQYLKALHEHRHPAVKNVRDQSWSLWLDTLPEHETIEFKNYYAHVFGDGEQVQNEEATAIKGSEPFLKVRRPQLQNCPKPPDSIVEFLEKNWEDPSQATAYYKDYLVRKGAEEAEFCERFVWSQDRISDFDKWKVSREAWILTEIPARQSAKVFETFYDLYGRLQREGEAVELVLADGILNWRRSDGGIHHPTILQKVQLEFEAKIPEFRLTETQSPCEFYGSVFSECLDVDSKTVKDLTDEAKQFVSPLQSNELPAFLKGMVQRLHSNGEFLDIIPAGEKDYPRSFLRPLLLVRSRAAGLSAALLKVLEDIKTKIDFPQSLCKIVGFHNESTENLDSKPPTEPVLSTMNATERSGPSF